MEREEAAKKLKDWLKRWPSESTWISGRDIADAYTDCWPQVKAAIAPGDGAYPDSFWKRSILMAGDPAIRNLKFSWTWVSLPFNVSRHFATKYTEGITHTVHDDMAELADIAGINRDELPEARPVGHHCVADAQTLIDISKKELCAFDPDRDPTDSMSIRDAWKKVRSALAALEPELASCMVCECISCGRCPYKDGCGFVEKTGFSDARAQYLNLKGFVPFKRGGNSPASVIDHVAVTSLSPSSSSLEDGEHEFICDVYKKPGDFILLTEHKILAAASDDMPLSTAASDLARVRKDTFLIAPFEVSVKDDSIEAVSAEIAKNIKEKYRFVGDQAAYAKKPSRT